MNAKLAAAVIAIAVLPLAVVAWLGVRTIQNEQQLITHRFDKIIMARLGDVNGILERVITRREGELRRALDVDDPDTETLRMVARSTPSVTQTFRLDSENRLVHPPARERNRGETHFVERTLALWESKEPFYRPKDDAAGPDHGWHTWYSGGGINLFFWQRTKDGGIVGAELSRTALVAEFIGELPATEGGETNLMDGRIVLESSAKEPLYGFGSFEPDSDLPPRVTRALSPPLGAWRLVYFHDPSSVTASAKGPRLILWFGLGGFVLGVLVLALFVLKEHGRERREATKRVTFVNQVSHELKTPLTNIRMYAELLEDEMDDEKSRGREYLGVITSESRRLSRLILNVLTFARKQHLNPKAAVVDDEIERVLEYHRPMFAQLGTTVVFEGDAKDTCKVDVDVLGQVVGNLLSNAKKYAADEGRVVTVTSRRAGDRTIVRVSDEGPGIPRGQRDKIFKPFYRISGDVTEGVSGTGIGLSISRDLAALHGGELTLVPSEVGAAFELSIATAKC